MSILKRSLYTVRNIYKQIKIKIRECVTKPSLKNNYLLEKYKGKNQQHILGVIEHRQLHEYYHQNSRCHNKCNLRNQFNAFG